MICSPTSVVGECPVPSVSVSSECYWCSWFVQCGGRRRRSYHRFNAHPLATCLLLRECARPLNVDPDVCSVLYLLFTLPRASLWESLASRRYWRLPVPRTGQEVNRLQCFLPRPQGELFQAAAPIGRVVLFFFRSVTSLVVASVLACQFVFRV